MRVRRLTVTLTLAALAVGLVAVPASAATVRVVDGDGKGSVVSCDSSARAFKKVQSAVDAASAGDTVLVCPGTYDEQLVIGASKDGLKLRGASHLTATIQPTAPQPKSGVIVILADHVTVSGLSISYAADLPPVAGACSFLTSGIMAAGDDVRLRANSIVVTGAGRRSCGIVAGIHLAHEGGTATVRYNVVKDFMVTGIVANGPGLRMSAFRNTVRFFHRGAAPIASRRVPGGLAPAGGRQVILAPGTGILVSGGAIGVIRENTVEASRPGRGPLSGHPDALYLGIGIAVDSATASIVRANRVYRAEANIATMLSFAAQTTSGPTIAGNTAIAGKSGILLQGIGASVTGNQAQANQVGLWAAPGTASNTLTGNQATVNGVFGCLDSTGQDAGSVANAWSDNDAVTDAPQGICVTQG